MTVAVKKKRGGGRPGSGRPFGAISNLVEARNQVNQYTKWVSPEMQEQIATMTPKEIMLIAARLAAAEGDWESASVRAQRCAPYFDRQLSHITLEATVRHESKLMKDEDLVGMINLLQAEWTEVK